MAALAPSVPSLERAFCKEQSLPLGDGYRILVHYAFKPSSFNVSSCSAEARKLTTVLTRLLSSSYSGSKLVSAN